MATPSSSPSLPPIAPPSLEDILGRSTGTTSTPETGSTLPGFESVNQKSNDCLISDIEARVPFDQLDTSMNVSKTEHAQMVCKLCVTGLPIEQIVTYAVGMFVTCILSYLSFEYRCAQVLVSSILVYIPKGLHSVICLTCSPTKSVTNLVFASRDRKGYFAI